MATSSLLQLPSVFSTGRSCSQPRSNRVWQRCAWRLQQRGLCEYTPWCLHSEEAGSEIVRMYAAQQAVCDCSPSGTTLAVHDYSRGVVRLIHHKSHVKACLGCLSWEASPLPGIYSPINHHSSEALKPAFFCAPSLINPALMSGEPWCSLIMEKAKIPFPL